MSDKVILVTPPDDILVDGLRLLLVDLTQEQTQMISDAFTSLKTIPTIVAYVWSQTYDTEWLLDKKLKSNLIIFNANSENDAIIGYMAAQSNACYFGELKDLKNANNMAIYNVDQLKEILEKVIEKHGI